MYKQSEIRTKQHRDGFTLIEVMVALAIIGFALTAIAALEMTLIRTTHKASLSLDRLWNMKLFFYETRIKKLQGDEQKKFTKTVQEPPLALTFEQKPVPKGSALSPLEDLKIERIDAQWQTAGRTLNDTMIYIRYQPEHKDETGHKSS